MNGYYEKQVTDILIGKNKTKGGFTEIERAKAIKKSLGVKVAALYMRKREWSIESALYVLASR